MGQRQSLEDDLITFRLTSKQMTRSARKCEKNQEIQKEKLKKAIAEGNMEGARIYGQNAIREKNQALTFLRLSSRIDAVASRLETAIRMQDVNKAMGQTVKGMSNAMKSMEPERIAKTMDEFERQFEDMDVVSGYMESAMDSTTALATPPEQVDSLIQEVADAAGLEVAGMMGETSKTQYASSEAHGEKDSLESRLANLRK